MTTYHMTSSELKALKPRDTVCIGGLTFSVEKSGSKWVTLKNTRKTIDIALARIKYNGYGSNDTSRIFKDRDSYNQHGWYHKRIQDIRKVIGRTSFSEELLLEFEPILKKHGLLEDQ